MVLRGNVLRLFCVFVSFSIWFFVLYLTLYQAKTVFGVVEIIC